MSILRLPRVLTKPDVTDIGSSSLSALDHATIVAVSKLLSAVT